MKIAGYMVETLVGESPTSVLYKVRHPKLQSVHACKLMPSTVREVPSVRATFFKIQWQIENQSPFFIRVTDVIETEDDLGFVMDWLEGRALSEHLERYGKVEVLPAVRWVVQLLSALHTFHIDQQIHLDIHDKNIFLQQSEKGTVAVLMDDGIHRHVTDALDSIATGADRLRYQAPEEVHKQSQVGPWTDVYRIGVVFYQMLLGRTPFNGDTEYSIMHAINGGRYQSVLAGRPDVPVDLAAIIDKALHKDSTQRFQSAHEMLTAIQSTVSLPDVLEPIEPSNTKKAEPEPNVDILIEQDGEWVLQSAEEIHSESEEDGEKLGTKSSRKPFSFHGVSSQNRGWSWNVSPLLWRWRWRLLGGGVLVIGLVSLWLGGLFGGRDSVVEVRSTPLWGTTNAKLDHEPMPRQPSEMKLTLGQHQVDVTGGVSVSGSCGRCCWSHTEEFRVPLVGGHFVQWLI